jgi:CelD/BcsL family acetyltransferase involved in cellulose biosynthesis
VKTNIIDNIQALGVMEEPWRRLFDKSRSDNPFLTWEWNQAWIPQFSGGEGINIVIVEDGGEVVAIAPFCVNPRSVQFLADSLFADYMDVLCVRPDHELIRSVFEALDGKVRWGRMALRTIPESSPNLRVIEEVVRNRSLFVECRPIHENPFVDCTKDFEEYLKNRSNGIKKELRRTKNRLAQDGARWEFVEAATDEQKDEIYQKLIEFHLQRQDGKVGNSIFGTEKNREFFRKVIKTKGAPWTPHVAGISMDGRIVSASISLICGKVFYYWITSFDSSLGGGSIGNFYVKLLLEKCFREGIVRFDFMGGTESYKLRWGDATYANYEIRAYRSRFMKMRDDMWIKMRAGMTHIRDDSKICALAWRKVSKYIRK